MTKTDFFRVFIKCIGLFSAINAAYMMFPNISYSQGNISFGLFLNGLIILFMFLIAFVLIFKTDWIISLFKLSKGYDSDNIDFGELKNKSFLTCGIILTGLYIMVDSLPNFLYYTYLWFKAQVSANDFNENVGYVFDYNWWAISGLSVVIGFILVTNNERISNWFSQK